MNQTATNRCHICRAEAVTELVNFGNQALCNRFLSKPGEKEALFPFAVGQCSACGLVQFSNPISPDELRARVDWITYNEQEGHLDDLVETICKLPGVSSNYSVGAISFKDDTFLTRFEKKGFKAAWRINPAVDLGITDPCAGLETVQAQLSVESASAIAAKRQPVDILLVRHILEHAHQPARFAEGLKKLVKRGGYFIFEVPDCAPALDRGDYTMPWEEHILYFTPETFRNSLARLGFNTVHVECYPYSNENSLVAIAKAGADSNPKTSPKAPETELQRGGKYGRMFPDYGERTAKTLAEYRKRGVKTALFGAGHLTCAWVNFLGVQELVEFVVDDHPRKKGLFMPGSHLPIHSSNILLEGGIKLCLLGLSAESEARVTQKNQSFIEQGGAFGCIFPGRGNSFPG